LATGQFVVGGEAAVKPLNADLSTKQITNKRQLIALMFLLQPEVISSAAAY
jgi:hypothetical protein